MSARVQIQDDFGRWWTIVDVNERGYVSLRNDAGKDAGVTRETFDRVVPESAEALVAFSVLPS